MVEALISRKATLNDLRAIINLLLEDELGQTRESKNTEADKRYIDTFHKINTDPNQYLMVVEQTNEIVSTCHLTIMPSLTFTGRIRMNIEAVRVIQKYRGQKIGEWMMQEAIKYAQSRDASIVQLTTHKQRISAKRFYENLGFKASHEGMKMYL
jgi:ribosomal protein S18 acetylase RimI-like enzyme